MVTIKAYTPDGKEHIINAPQNGVAFDKADAIGAVKIIDGLNEKFIKIAGDWFALPKGREKP